VVELDGRVVVGELVDGRCDQAHPVRVDASDAERLPGEWQPATHPSGLREPAPALDSASRLLDHERQLVGGEIGLQIAEPGIGVLPGLTPAQVGELDHV
jgi:hypothetical protein